MPHSNCCAINENNGNVSFNAVGRDGRLRNHIQSAFLDSTLMYLDTPFKELTFKRITYQVHYERCDPALFPKQLVKAIISFQHWKDGTNHAIIRPWAPRPTALE